MNIIDVLEQAQMKQNIPAFNAGDTVVVQVKVKEGDKERTQAFEGIVINNLKPQKGYFLMPRTLFFMPRIMFAILPAFIFFIIFCIIKNCFSIRLTSCNS